MTQEEIIEGNKLIAEFMGLPYDYYKCDHCGKIDPETFNGRLTKCCSTYDKEHKFAFYKTKDEKGIDVYSIGKRTNSFIQKSEDLNYHSSWDWLMPVVEKIGSTLIPKEWINNAKWNLQVFYSITQVGTGFEIGDHDLHITDSGIEALEWLNTSKSPIERTWLAVLEFIKWYNKTK